MISAVVRTKNCSHVIGATLRALREQSSPPGEVIVVDSGSTDDTLTIVAREWPEAVGSCTGPPESPSAIPQP
ncbi:MAG: glycosyltransferase family 2 protein [Verrucomicrobiota bacterium]